MITNQPLTLPTYNFDAASEVRQATSADSDYSRVIREIYLRRLIDGTVKQNEAQAVATGISIMDLNDGRVLYSHNENTEQFAASINKLPVALLLLEDLRAGKIRMGQMVSWAESDRRGGFGDFDQPGSPLQAPLRDVVYDMLHNSGNTAVRVSVNNVLGGPYAVNDRWATKPQLARTRLQPLDATRFYLGNSTPHDSLWAIRQLTKRQDAPAVFMRDAMKDNIFVDFGVRSQLPDSDFLILVNKIGLLDDAEGNNRHDVGIIYNTRTHRPYAYALMTTAPYNAGDPAATLRADQSLKDIGGALFRFAGGSKRVGGQTSSEVRNYVETRMRY
ncbi:MAG TPA: serine hydrolase [Candidatus Saccharimonadales bacterium]|nr:serine hydrolase [Candidatus Saccharimonadales bacterium]